MDQSSRRRHRPWTAHEQVTAEVAAACGVSLKQMGAALSRDHKLIRYHLIPGVNSRTRELTSKWAECNRERHRERVSKWLKANPDRVREYAVRWRQLNPEIARERDREKYRRRRERNPEWSRAYSARRRAAYAAKKAAANALPSADS